MKRTAYILLIIFLTACSQPVIDVQRTQMVDGNKLQITSGHGSNRFVEIDNVDVRWVGKYKGGSEKWGVRKELFQNMAADEISKICGGGWAFVMKKPYTYRMLDNDETMGGAAPVLGTTASMAAYLVAYSQTKDENIPVSVYTEFTCRFDEE